MNLVEMRARIEIDLKDSGNVRWTDAELDRAIGKAVAEYSEAMPRVVPVDKTVDSAKWFDLSAEEDYLRCEAIEYPVDADNGPFYRPYRENRDAKTVSIIGERPVPGDSIRFWCAKMHTLDVTTSTIPPEHEEIIALGAAAFAVLELASYSINRVNVTASAPEQYQEWAEPRLAEFRGWLQEMRQVRVAGVGGAMVSWNGGV